MPSSWCNTSNVSWTQPARALFGSHHQNGFGSCALVGSSGTLLRDRFGEEIDSHEFVIRTNLAPLEGFGPVVGKKTSLRVLSSGSLSTALIKRACPELRANRTSFCPEYAIHLNSKNLLLKSRLRGALDQVHQACELGMVKMGPVGENSDLVEPTPVVSHFSRLRGNVVTGVWALELAMRLCPNGVNLFGFTDASNLQRSRRAPYHYFDEQLYARNVDISRDGAASAFSELARLQPQCVRLRHSGGRAKPFLWGRQQQAFRTSEQQRRRRRVDPFVDGLPHVYAWVGAKVDVPNLRQPVAKCPWLPAVPDAAPRIPAAAAHDGLQCSRTPSHITVQVERRASNSKNSQKAIMCTQLQQPNLRFMCNIPQYRGKIQRHCKGVCFPCPVYRLVSGQ